MLLAVVGCEKSAPSTAVQEQARAAVPDVKSQAVVVGDDCSIILPAGYRGPDALSQEKSRPPSNPNVIAWNAGAWGAIEASWRISRGGNGCFMENERNLPNDGRQQKVHMFQVSSREFDEIAATLDYQSLNNMMTNCANFMSDAENGSIDWYGIEHVSWVRYDRGDKCAGSDRFYQIMDRVTARIKAKARP